MKSDSGRKDENSPPSGWRTSHSKPGLPSLDDLQPPQPPQPLGSLLLDIREEVSPDI